jgi:hypothetical protein
MRRQATEAQRCASASQNNGISGYHNLIHYPVAKQLGGLVGCMLVQRLAAIWC